MELETKTFDAPAANDAYAELMRVFETFKEANDRRLTELEKRSSDVVTEEKVERIGRALDE